MSTTIFQNTYNHPLIKKDEIVKIMAAHQKIKFSKGDVLLERGKIANAYYLIESGLLKMCLHDYNGNEITTAFHGKEEISIEVASLFQRIPTKERIVALSNGTAWKIEFEAFQELYQCIAGFSEWGRGWMSTQLFMLKQRSIDMLTKTAGERYLILLNERPEIIQHAPIKCIASYLGVTDTSLSRIRKEIYRV